jgi:hypothetical protein
VYCAGFVHSYSLQPGPARNLSQRPRHRPNPCALVSSHSRASAHPSRAAHTPAQRHPANASPAAVPTPSPRATAAVLMLTPFRALPNRYTYAVATRCPTATLAPSPRAVQPPRPRKQSPRAVQPTRPSCRQVLYSHRAHSAATPCPAAAHMPSQRTVQPPTMLQQGFTVCSPFQCRRSAAAGLGRFRAPPCPAAAKRSAAARCRVFPSRCARRRIFPRKLLLAESEPPGARTRL